MNLVTAVERSDAVDRAPVQRWRRAVGLPFLLLAPALALVVFFIAVPFVGVIAASFRQSPTDASFTTAHYAMFVSDPFYLSVIANTITTSVIVTILSLLIGYPLALYVNFSQDRYRRFLILAILSPLLVSVVVRSYALVLLLSANNPIDRLLPFGWNIDVIFTRSAVVIGLIYTLLPFMVLSILSSLSSMDPRLIAAARSLGASSFTALRRVVLPLSAQGILAGCLIVFTLSMTSFALPLMLGGASYKMMVSLIYSDILVLFDWPAGYAVSNVLLILTGVILLATARLIGRRAAELTQ